MPQFVITIAYDPEDDSVGYRCSPNAPRGHQYAALERARDYVQDLHIQQAFGIELAEKTGPQLVKPGPVSDAAERRLRKGPRTNGDPK